MKAKLLALAGVSVAGAFLLAACMEVVATKQPTHSFIQRIQIPWITSLQLVTTTSDVTSNLVDGLLENDRYGNFVPSLAEDWTVSEDGLNLYPKTS